VRRSKRTRAIAAAVSCRCAWLAAALCFLMMMASATAAAAAAPNAALGLLPAPPQPLQDASAQQPEELAIPRILHQSWRTAALPARFAPFVVRCFSLTAAIVVVVADYAVQKVCP
jgi:hypothetical protein